MQYIVVLRILIHCDFHPTMASGCTGSSPLTPAVVKYYFWNDHHHVDTKLLQLYTHLAVCRYE